MPETIILTLFIAKLRRYKIKPLLKVWSFYVILFFEVIYAVVQINIFMHHYEALKYMGIFKTVYLSSYICMILQCKLYKQALMGAGSLAGGSILNQIAIVTNGGKMPVFPSLSLHTGYISLGSMNSVDTLHRLGDQAVHAFFLTDYLDIGYAILSIGDILIRLFALIILFGCIRSLNQHQEGVLSHD